jgi:hypothetical protein
MKRFKAQTLVFENVLIFGIGVAIFILSYAAFTAYQLHFSGVGNNDQMNRVKDILVSNILMLGEKEAVNSSVTLKIPKKIGADVYKVELSNGGINISLSNVYVFSPIYNLNKSLTLSGKAVSIKGKVTIYKKGNKIIII